MPSMHRILENMCIGLTLIRGMFGYIKGTIQIGQGAEHTRKLLLMGNRSGASSGCIDSLKNLDLYRKMAPGLGEDTLKRRRGDLGRLKREAGIMIPA